MEKKIINATDIPQINDRMASDRVDELLSVAISAATEVQVSGVQTQTNKVMRINPVSAVLDRQAVPAAEEALNRAGYNVRLSTHFYGSGCYVSVALPVTERPDSLKARLKQGFRNLFRH